MTDLRVGRYRKTSDFFHSSLGTSSGMWMAGFMVMVVVVIPLLVMVEEC